MKRARGKGGLAGPDGSKSVFGQLAAKQTVFNADSLMLPHRVWKVKFVGKLTSRFNVQNGSKKLVINEYRPGLIKLCIKAV